MSRTLRSRLAVALCLGFPLGVGCGSGAIDDASDGGADGAPFESGDPLGDAANDASDTGRVTSDAADGSSPTDTESDSRADAVLTDAADAGGPIVETPCFRAPGKEAWSCGTDGKTLTRTRAGAKETVVCAHGCVALPSGFDHQCRPRDGAPVDTVNKHALSAEEAAWVHYFAWCAVPVLAGTRDARLDVTAHVAWWSLKEGVLDTSAPNPVGFNLCGDGGSDHEIAPLATCASGAAWQVGASGIQVPCCSLASVEATASKLFPGLGDAALLRGAALEAGYAPGSAELDGIVASTGLVKNAWLLHVTPIGFTFQDPIVTSECITGSASWCFSTAWEPSSFYAPDKAGATNAIGDLRKLLDVLSP